MATHLNAKLLQGLTGGTIAFTQPNGAAITGYVSPNLQSLRYSHKGEIKKVPTQGGNTGALVACDEFIELTFDFIPQGTSDANARESASVPELLSTGQVSGLPIIQIGSFADGLNTNGASTQPWIYEGDADGGGAAKEVWDGKITLRRYVSIASGAAWFTA